VPQLPHTVFAVVVHVLVRFSPAPHVPQLAHDVWPACGW
jgi:hypothetical protein